jgi:zinc finger HIT domain-containing protein 1
VSKKTTPNVRRILMSQKTFANHLADEEAAIAQQQQARQSAITLHTKIVPNLKRASTSELRAIPGSGPSQSTAKPLGGLPPPPNSDPLDDDPLLKSYVPSAPSEEVMEALLSGPPLSYNAARAGPPPAGKPQRHFCEICGYWGTVKCMKCGARVCGLECKGAHDDGRCLKFYA